MIKRPINFVCGVTLGFILVADIIKNADAFVIVIALIATIVNLTVAFME